MSAGRRYEFLFDLASGGMGLVSAATLSGERGFRRVVAVKRIRPDLADRPRFLELMAREANIAALVRHPGVVPVLELTEQDGELLLVMPLVEGVSLRKLCDAVDAHGGWFPESLACRILEEVADALAAAHEARDQDDAPAEIVHRDISPQNVLISFDGEVKVTDFGIAKVVRGVEPTESSTVRGKPAYLSPEQARGGGVDARTDIWSLGVVGFELLSGQRLFKGRNDLETLRRLLDDPIPRLSQVRDTIPDALAECIDRCLQREAEDRWPSARALAEALREALPREARSSRDELAALVAEVLPGHREALREDLRVAMSAASTPPPSPPSRSRAPLWVAGALGFTLALGARAAIGAATPPEAPARPEARPTPLVPAVAVDEPTPPPIDEETVVAPPPEAAPPAADPTPDVDIEPTPRVARRRGGRPPREAPPAETSPPPRDPVDRIVGEFPL
ncbi:MAG: serine/threonine-protein kinase [Sandaracinaceae bacterium]